MERKHLQELLCKEICEAIRLEDYKPNAWVIDTPFAFPDGDHFQVILQQKGEGWKFTDEGHTLFHLADLGFEIDTPTRQEHFLALLRGAGAEYVDGEICLLPQGGLGEGLIQYMQLLQQITDLVYLRRETVHRAFREDVERVLRKYLAENVLQKDYYDKEADPEKAYTVDFRIERDKRPIFLFAIANDEQCDRAALKLYWYERRGIPFTPLGIFEDEGKIAKTVLRRFADICPHRLFSLNEELLRKTLVEEFKATLKEGT